MAMSNANLAVALKRAAKTITEINNKKAVIKKQIDSVEEKFREQLEKKLAKLRTQYTDLEEQQEIFEMPIRECTGGYRVEELIEAKIIETGTDKNGKALRKTVYNLRYPETIVPPPEKLIKCANPTDDSETKKESNTIEEGYSTKSSFDDLPFSN